MHYFPFTKIETILTPWLVAQAGSNNEKKWRSKISLDCWQGVFIQLLIHNLSLFISLPLSYKTLLSKISSSECIYPNYRDILNRYNNQCVRYSISKLTPGGHLIVHMRISFQEGVRKGGEGVKGVGGLRRFSLSCVCVCSGHTLHTIYWEQLTVVL